METITKKQAEALAERGITYEVSKMWYPDMRDGQPVCVIKEHHFDDEEGKDPLDIHLDRLRPLCGEEYKALLEGKTNKVENALPFEEVTPVPDWTVDEDGALVNKEKAYEISPDQLLNKKDWILHVMKKPWVNLNSFIPAYLLALKRLGVKTAQILTSYD